MRRVLSVADYKRIISFNFVLRQFKKTEINILIPIPISNSTSSIIYVKPEENKNKLLELCANTGVTENNEFIFNTDFYASFPLFFEQVNFKNKKNAF